MSRYPTLLIPLDLGFTQLRNRVLGVVPCTLALKRKAS